MTTRATPRKNRIVKTTPILTNSFDHNIPVRLEMRYILRCFENVRKDRIRIQHRVNTMKRIGYSSKKSWEMLNWILLQTKQLEKQHLEIIESYYRNHKMAWFFDQIPRFDTITAVYLMNEIEIGRAKNAASIWSMCGYHAHGRALPGYWVKGFNHELRNKVKDLGAYFVRWRVHPYDDIFRERRAIEWQENLWGDNANEALRLREKIPEGKEPIERNWLYGRYHPEQVRRMLLENRSLDYNNLKKYPDGTFKPMLAPVHLMYRSYRFITKLFLAHLYWRWYEEEYGRMPPKPYIFDKYDCVQLLQPPQRKKSYLDSIGKV